MTSAPAPSSDLNDPLTHFWERPVSELAAVDSTAISREAGERHTILSLLTMALVADCWNGNKRGAWGDYPWRKSQRVQDGPYAGGSYLGHNIGCISVDARGEIIDFDFNHNEVFSSSAEHAEARLVRRIFNLDRNYCHWQTVDPEQIVDMSYSTVLSGVTLYTSLESCAQCSGIMTLGNVKSVVYLQSDPGQYRIGNILYNLSNPLTVSHPSGAVTGLQTSQQKYGAPEPVSAGLFGFGYKRELEDAYAAFAAAVEADKVGHYFWKSPDGSIVDASTGITSFLCTDVAKAIFNRAAAHLADYVPAYPDFGPVDGELAMLSNARLLDQARRFRGYVARTGHRGTPHK